MVGFMEAYFASKQEFSFSFDYCLTHQERETFFVETINIVSLVNTCSTLPAIRFDMLHGQIQKNRVILILPTLFTSPTSLTHFVTRYIENTYLSLHAIRFDMPYEQCNFDPEPLQSLPRLDSPIPVPSPIYPSAKLLVNICPYLHGIFCDILHDYLRDILMFS